MRAVVNGDQQVELLLDHVGADGGETFVEGHDRLGTQIASGAAGVAEVGVGEQLVERHRCWLIMPCWWV